LKINHLATRGMTSYGGVAQRTLHPTREQKTRVRIPPGYKVSREGSNAVLCYKRYIPVYITLDMRKTWLYHKIRICNDYNLHGQDTYIHMYICMELIN
jgi:hypothetical protein